MEKNSGKPRTTMGAIDWFAQEFPLDETDPTVLGGNVLGENMKTISAALKVT